MTPCGLEFQFGRLGQRTGAQTISDCRRASAAEDLRANGQVEFAYQAGAEQGVVEFAAAFAEEPTNPPPLAQPAQCAAEIDLLGAANLDCR